MRKFKKIFLYFLGGVFAQVLSQDLPDIPFTYGVSANLGEREK